MLGYHSNLKHGRTCEYHTYINLLLVRCPGYSDPAEPCFICRIKKKLFVLPVNHYLVLQGVLVQ